MHLRINDAINKIKKKNLNVIVNEDDLKKVSNIGNFKYLLIRKKVLFKFV